METFDPSADIGEVANKTAIAPKDGQSVDDWLASVPVTVVDLEQLVNYPSKDVDGKSEVVSTRVPPHWMVAFDEIREQVQSNLPNLWKTRAELVRWCIFQGMQHLKEINARVNDPMSKNEPMLRARLFTERGMGDIHAQASIIQSTFKQTDDIAKAVRTLIALNEFTEAAKMILIWIERAKDQDADFWRSFFINVLFLNQSLNMSIKYLIDDGYLTDEAFVDAYKSFIPPSEEQWKQIIGQESQSPRTSQTSRSSRTDGTGDPDSAI